MSECGGVELVLCGGALTEGGSWEAEGEFDPQSSLESEEGARE